MLYQAYQTQSDLLSPWRLAAQSLASALWVPRTERSWLRQIAAACDLVSRLRLTHSRPPYGIGEVLVNGEPVAVDEKVGLSLPFGRPDHNRDDKRAAATLSTIELRRVVAEMVG